MCFSSKAKQPKVDPQSIAAPAPVNEEAPKGVEFGDDSSDDSETKDGIKDLKIKKEEQGDGTPAALVAKDTGISTKKKSPNASVKRALKR